LEYADVRNMFLRIVNDNLHETVKLVSQLTIRV